MMGVEPSVRVQLNPIYRQLADLSNRITALEMVQDKARATAPVSDDEIIEALADSLYAKANDGREWSSVPDGNKQMYRSWARDFRSRLNDLNFDVVKRS